MHLPSLRTIRRLQALSKNGRLLLIVLALTFLGFTLPTAVHLAESIDTKPGHFRVISVSDGDTIVVSMDGQPQTIRLVGVDTPETHHPDKDVQCFGRAASDFTTNLLLDSQVRLEHDKLSLNRDRYDRLLRYVYSEEGVLVNRLLVEQGYGFAYTSFPFTQMEAFINAEEFARRNDKGLWQACHVDLENGFLSTNAVG